MCEKSYSSKKIFLFLTVLIAFHTNNSVFGMKKFFKKLQAKFRRSSRARRRTNQGVHIHQNVEEVAVESPVRGKRLCEFDCGNLGLIAYRIKSDIRHSKIGVFDILTGEKGATFNSLGSSTALKIHPYNSDIFLLGSYNRKLSIWDVAGQGKCIKEVECEGALECVAFNHDNPSMSVFVSHSQDCLFEKVLTIWETESGSWYDLQRACQTRFSRNRRDSVSDICFFELSDSSIILSCHFSLDNSVMAFRIRGDIGERDIIKHPDYDNVIFVDNDISVHFSKDESLYHEQEVSGMITHSSDSVDNVFEFYYVDSVAPLIIPNYFMPTVFVVIYLYKHLLQVWKQRDQNAFVMMKEITLETEVKMISYAAFISSNIIALVKSHKDHLITYFDIENGREVRVGSQAKGPNVAFSNARPTGQNENDEERVAFVSRFAFQANTGATVTFDEVFEDSKRLLVPLSLLYG